MTPLPVCATVKGYRVNFNSTFTEVAHDCVQWWIVLLAVGFSCYYRGADKSLARSGGKQVNVSLRVA